VQFVVAEPPVEDEAVERLLHLVAGPVQLIEEEHIRFVARDGLWRAEAALRLVSVPHDPGNPDEVLGGELGTEQGLAF
jgi:hypothetical protein